MYYGWDGEKQWSGFTSEKMGLVITSLALDYFYTGDTHRIANNFINYVNSMDMPQMVLDFSNRNLTAYTIENNMQRTESVTVTGNSEYYLTLKLQNSVTLVNETKNTQHNGTVNIYGGDTFYLMAPLNINGTWISDNINNCKYTFQPIIYRTSSEKYQDLAGRLSVLADPSTTTNLTVNWLETGAIKIYKKDETTGSAISDTTFEIRKQDGTVEKTITTDSNGFAEATGLIAGTYTLVEVSANNNYILNNEPQQITISTGEIKTIEITNKHTEGNLKIIKVDTDNNNINLGNVQFDLYSCELDKIIGTYKTDVNGEIEIKDLRTGQYKLIETSTNKWYELAEDTMVTVKANELTGVTIGNELKKGSVKVIKVDKDNNEIRIPNVKFEVQDLNGNILETITTNEEGEAITKRYPIRDYERLRIKEIEINQNYTLNDDIVEIELEENQIKEITFENEKKKGKIKVIKVDLDNNEIKIPNVEFNIYDENGQIIGVLVTDKNGEATSKELTIDQEYKIQEIKTGESYILSDELKTVILEQEQITEIIFTNEKKKGQIKVIKVDLDNNEILLEGVTFDVLDENGNIVYTITTDNNGEATTKKLAIDQTYTVVEKETKKEYVLTEETKTVELKQDEITTIVFENEKIKGYVEITKVDSKTKETLEGAEFRIYNENNEQIETIKTDNTGKATCELIYGKYYLKELDTGSVYYLLNEDTFEFEITNNKETIPITIENEKTNIEVTVEKEGTREIKPGQQVDYYFSNIGNSSNIYLENFKWIDYIPTDYVRIETMTTGIWNQDLYYNVYYKTNKSPEYILFKENLSTQENYNLDFKTLELGEDEYIIETMFDFGKVDIGFKESTSPTMHCKSFNTLKDGQTFTNYTKTVGTYYDLIAEAENKWTTVVHTPKEEHEPVLPRTGK